MIKMDSKKSLRIPSQILFREIDGETVILNPETGVYYGLDPVGTRVWHLLRERNSLDVICSKLQAEYDVAESLCKKDVFKLADDLLKHGLIESSVK